MLTSVPIRVATAPPTQCYPVEEMAIYFTLSNRFVGWTTQVFPGVELDCLTYVDNFNRISPGLENRPQTTSSC